MTNRREFLQRSSLLALGGSLPFRGGDPSCKDRIGHGKFRYVADHKWGQLDPAEHSLQHCHEMVLDSRGRLLCSSVSRNHDVLVYNKDGKLLTDWRLGLTEPHGLSLAGEGNDQTFWITDSEGGRVLNLDLDGRIIRELAPPREHPFKPTETTITPNGDIYVADGCGSNFIFHYDVKGQLLRRFGGPDYFDCCHGIAVDHRTPTPTLLITSRAANNVQRWTLDGRHLLTRELPGLGICRPVIAGEQTYFAVIMTRSWNHYDGMVAVLDKDLNVLSLPGGSAPSDQTNFRNVVADDRTFFNPHDICVDEDENLYVPQWYSGRTYPVRLKRV